MSKLKRAEGLKSKKFWTIQRRKTLTGGIFVFPFLIGLLVFFAYPIVQSLMLAFGTLANRSQMSIEFAGFKHFYRAFFEDQNFVPWLLAAMRDTLINIPMITAFSVFIAILLNRNMPGKGIFRILFFLPVMLGTGFVMQQLLGQNVQGGSMGGVREFLLTEKVMFYLGEKPTAFVFEFFSRITLVLWRSGVQILIILSGLQAISASLYEAAEVDGANEWEVLWFITLPMLAPMILVIIVYSIVDTFNDSSSRIIGYITDMAFKWGSNYEYSSAMGWVYMLFALGLIGAAFLVMLPAIRNVSEKER